MLPQTTPLNPFFRGLPGISVVPESVFATDFRGQGRVLGDKENF
jgi:hypothetical protein